MKVFQVTIKEWFDKVNGNTYFSARGLLCEEGKEDVTFELPFQYGYGSHSEFEMGRLLAKHFGEEELNAPLSLYCRDIKGIKLFLSRYPASKKEVKNFVS